MAVYKQKQRCGGEAGAPGRAVLPWVYQEGQCEHFAQWNPFHLLALFPVPVFFPPFYFLFFFPYPIPTIPFPIPKEQSSFVGIGWKIAFHLLSAFLWNLMAS